MTDPVEKWAVLLNDKDQVLRKYYPGRYQIGKAYKISHVEPAANYILVEGINSTKDPLPSLSHGHYYLLASNFRIEDPFQTKVREALQTMKTDK
ncbi:hypothetical protein CLV58_109112 [Spirosoma oryzae]|uniref:Uncharacterized protein n=1 Tax=Spirosoma oryzae TaxID=1469603 RepID=A0A2T0SY95_9BACT|nr:hypothetical protein [Spirosoma oryzae]PRY38385.1 hypothetical protein CLV58_109112 [Spirosoma oryzae]